jgi:hypothetical protein
MGLSTSETIITVGVASGTFLAANPNRIGLLISSGAANGITISKTTPAVYGNGLRIAPLTSVTQLFVSTVGNWFQNQTYAIANVGAETIGVLEVIQV